MFSIIASGQLYTPPLFRQLLSNKPWSYCISSLVHSLPARPQTSLPPKKQVSLLMMRLCYQSRPLCSLVTKPAHAAAAAAARRIGITPKAATCCIATQATGALGANSTFTTLAGSLQVAAVWFQHLCHFL
jgi:hypothetical protein